MIKKTKRPPKKAIVNPEMKNKVKCKTLPTSTLKKCKIRRNSITVPKQTYQSKPTRTNPNQDTVKNGPSRTQPLFSNTSKNSAPNGLFSTTVSQQSKCLKNSRTQNNLKNKFYGHIKMIIRRLLKEYGNISGQRIKHMTANELTELY